MLKLNYHIDRVIKIISQSVEMYKRSNTSYLFGLNVALLYYNCFIQSAYSCGLFFGSVMMKVAKVN